jgi:presenilin-like A22 family membrane protease
VLGELAMIINIFFCAIALILILMKKIKQISLWIVIFNFIILLAQIYWFFIDNSK